MNGAVCDQSSCGVWIIVLGALVCDWACEAHVPGRRTQPVDVYLTQQLLSRYGVVDAGEPNAPSHRARAESNKAFIISQRTVLGQQLQHADIGLPYVLLPRGRRQSATVDALSTSLAAQGAPLAAAAGLGGGRGAFFRAYRDETQLTVARFLHSHDKRACRPTVRNKGNSWDPLPPAAQPAAAADATTPMAE